MDQPPEATLDDLKAFWQGYVDYLATGNQGAIRGIVHSDFHGSGGGTWFDLAELTNRPKPRPQRVIRSSDEAVGAVEGIPYLDAKLTFVDANNSLRKCRAYFDYHNGRCLLRHVEMEVVQRDRD
jgi:hypothetical protein